MAGGQEGIGEMTTKKTRTAIRVLLLAVGNRIVSYTVDIHRYKRVRGPWDWGLSQ